jgi:hypothetical protein
LVERMAVGGAARMGEQEGWGWLTRLV